MQTQKEKQIETEMVAEAMKAISILPKLKPEERASYLSALLLISYKLLRTVEGDQFVEGWLEGALNEVRTQPPDVVINELH